MRKTSILIVCVLVLLGVGAAIIILRPSGQAQGTQSVATIVATSSDVTTTEQGQSGPVIPEGLREYQSTMYHFSLLYPQELSVAETAEGGGASTVTFQNVQEVKGFQIFIVPYAEAQISDARFKEDEPSGVREQLTNIVLDGATGAAFYSTDAALGETREVWFVRGGYLYEVTTLRPLDSWLSQIMQTWQFL
jgi:hypothetical protein